MCLLAIACLSRAADAATPPLLPEPVIAALASELDGARAKRDVEVFAQLHRMRASEPFHRATEHIVAELRRAGLDRVEVLRFPADGTTMFGTQRARPAWDAEFAELWELERRGEQWQPAARIASWESMPLSLAQDSDSGEATADLVDVGAGTREQDYAGKQVRGQLVLTSSQPEAVAPLAVDRFGAAGIVSYAQNQPTAWSREDESLVRWGHLDSFSPRRTFGFMVSLKQARSFQARLSAGETVRLQATVKAQRHAGEYEIVSASIAGADPVLARQQIAFTCHLDHPRPGANDNASGCATILEVARSYARLIAQGKLARPRRTLHFLWPPEIEGSTILLNARPDLAGQIVADIHMDMVGGGPRTKAVFHVTRSPASLPNFVNDVAEAFAAFVNAESDAFAAGRDTRYPMIAAGGDKQALLAQLKEFDAGSDHVVFTDSSFRIPAIYMNDWPDRYIHTNGDLPENIDATKLQRAGFIGAASGWFLANLSADDLPAVSALLEHQSLRRTAVMLERRSGLPPVEQGVLETSHMAYERGVLDSMERWLAVPDATRAARERFLGQLAAMSTSARVSAGREPPGVVYVRNAEPKGPMTVFGYDYLVDRLGAERAAALALTEYSGLRGGGGEYAVEALNFVDGRRSVRDIRDALSAEFGPVPLEHVAAYLEALETIKVLRRR
ncbi:MAG TPA: M28 family peptidase [Steroidobacteraceae bacterium]|nr:M28 family peptidase [Steroidobacteraceae bacterium]